MEWRYTLRLENGMRETDNIEAPTIELARQRLEARGSEILERMEVRELIEKWVLYRDAADWENFRSLWADDGRMIATWFSGPAEEFIKVSIEGVDQGRIV